MTDAPEGPIVSLLAGLASIEVLRPGTARELVGTARQAFLRLLSGAQRAGRMVVTTKRATGILLKAPVGARFDIGPFAKTPRRLKLARIAAIGTRAKIAALPVLPVEIGLIVIGQTAPGEKLFKEIKRQVLKIQSDDPDEVLDGILALDLLLLTSGLAGVGIAGLAGAGVGGAVAIGAGILLEVALA